MAKPAIRNEDEYAGWRDVLSIFEQTIVNFQAALDIGDHHSPADYIRGNIAARIKARDALLPTIRAYQTSRGGDTVE